MTPCPKPVPEPKAAPRRIARGSRPRRQRRTSLAALKRRLWVLFARYVRTRDGSVCVTCRAEPADQAGHFYSRRIGSTWIDPKNVVAQGPRCNLFLHGNPGAFADYILREHGPQELERLTRRANQVRKDWRADEVRILIGHLERGDFAGFEMAYYEVNL